MPSGRGSPFSSWGGEALAIFHDDLNILGAITQRAAAKVKGNDLQSVRTQCVRVQDFKDGAETDVREGVRSKFVVQEAGRKVPANHTVRRAARRNILSHENILFQFWIYPLSLFSIVSHSLLWGTPRSELPKLPTDGARRV